MKIKAEMYGRPLAVRGVNCYNFALGYGEYEKCTARTSNARPYNDGF